MNEIYGYPLPDVPDEACWSEESEGDKACEAQWERAVDQCFGIGEYEGILYVWT